MADSPEYKTFCDLSDVIQTATRMSVSPVATKAFAKGLITAEQLNTMTFMFLPPDIQAQQLVQAVRDRIFIKPEALTFFRDILASDPVYETIVERIGKFCHNLQSLLAP